MTLAKEFLGKARFTWPSVSGHRQRMHLEWAGGGVRTLETDHDRRPNRPQGRQVEVDCGRIQVLIFVEEDKR